MYGTPRDLHRVAATRICNRLRSASRWTRKPDSPAKPAPDSRSTVPPSRKHLAISLVTAAGSATAAGTISTGQRDRTPADARAYPASDSRNEQCSFRSSTATTAGSWRGEPSLGNATVIALAAQPRNSRRLMTISELPGNQPVHRLRRIVELLVGRVAVARFHLRDQPAVVPDLRHGRADGGPVV